METNPSDLVRRLSHRIVSFLARDGTCLSPVALRCLLGADRRMRPPRTLGESLIPQDDALPEIASPSICHLQRRSFERRTGTRQDRYHEPRSSLEVSSSLQNTHFHRVPPPNAAGQPSNNRHQFLLPRNVAHCPVRRLPPFLCPCMGLVLRHPAAW